MAATESEMLELGTVAPAFSLPDPDGEMHALDDGSAAYLLEAEFQPGPENPFRAGQAAKVRLP